ncbi:hypothetical protein ACE10Z_01095 [Bradyrhizobium sp. Pha-3]|uniref:hypothetical protein n=1 Tax=Bradyrhizobium sp. Pha-3 TaxID=208375 RepID=UPI0035D522A1
MKISMATNPGVNSSFQMVTFTLAERQAIMRLSRHFYITRAADPLQVGNSSYRAFLMRPTEAVSTVLNVEREIVVLFSDYETFESRSLRAIDMVCDQFDDVRVDRSLRFLISRDKNIESSIRHYLSQDPEYPIVIPFHFDDFHSANEDFIFNAVRKNYLIRDLFGYQSPLKQEYFFFGRQKLVGNVIDLHKSGQNSGLFGLRKSGKTSTIYAIQRRAKATGVRTILLDCQDPAIHARRFGALLQYLVTEVRRELNLRKLPIELGDSPDQISENFRRCMNEALSSAATDVLVIFDEIENVSPRTAASNHWRDSDDALLFWQTARAFFQSPQKHKLSFCFVGTNPHLFETPKLREVDNPVYLFAPKTFIPMLTSAETSELITRLGYFMGLDFGPSVVSYIHQRFGGHPFFIRQLCSQIHKKIPISRPREVSLQACKEAEQDANADIHGYLSEILSTLKKFYPDEHSMLEYLARGDSATFVEMCQYNPAYVEHLLGYGLVVRRGDDYEFGFDAIAESVKANFASPEISDLSDRWRQIGARRNRLEEEIRMALYRWAQRLDSEQWTTAVDNCLTQKRKQELGALGRRDAFSRNNSRLNFSELLQFIRFSDEFFTSYASKSDVAAAMNDVNKGRVDAHAKEISEDAFKSLIRSFELLEDIFLPPT